jgi:site-specific recombinase XerD
MKAADLSGWIQRFFQEYLLRQRNVSPATIAAYRDTFRLLLLFIRQKRRRAPSTSSLDSLTPEIVLSFLHHLETKRSNCIRTRNLRLAALRSFARYLVDWLEPQVPTSIRRILAIPFKRQVKPLLGFLTRQEIEAILEAAQNTWSGRRNQLLILLLYNTGARISEVLALRAQDIGAGTMRQLEVQGKGRKHRPLLLWRKTQRLLRHWIRENHLQSDMPVFPNRYGEPLTRFGAWQQLRQLVSRAALGMPSLARRRISLHTLRHSTAMSLLQSGVAPEVIALWLGHESPETTHQYVEADLAMKKKALDSIKPPKSEAHRFHPDDKLLSFLENLR